eukprot:g28518.t1
MVQQTQKFPSLEEQEQKLLMRRQEVIAERRKRDALHEYAAVEERKFGENMFFSYVFQRLKLKRREVSDELQPQQRFEGKAIACANSTVNKWQSRKMTDLSHVRSSSHWDVPGPGKYIGKMTCKIMYLVLESVFGKHTQHLVQMFRSR